MLLAVFAALLAVERPKEGFGGLMPISDTDMMAAHLTGLSDDELSSGSKLLTELKNLLIREQRLRAVIPLKEHNEKWMEQFGKFLDQLESAVKEHKATRNGSFFDELDYNRDESGWLHVEWSEDIRDTCNELKEQWQKIMDMGAWLKGKGTTYDIDHFMEYGIKKGKEIDVKAMVGIKGKDVEKCALCGIEAFYQSGYDPSWQEFPGAPVQRAYYTRFCACCGFQTYEAASFRENICGKDMIGQPLYANMTTEEVADLDYDDYYY